MNSKLILLGLIFLFSCKQFNKKTQNSLDGQLHGVAPNSVRIMKHPLNMEYIQPGEFHFGQSDEDVAYNFASKFRNVSVPGFWMDKTEISNNSYRRFVMWTRDSIAAIELGFYKVTYYNDGKDSTVAIDWKKASKIQYDKTNLEKLSNKLLTDLPFRIYGKVDVDPLKIKYHASYFDLKAAAQRINIDKSRSEFLKSYDLEIYPDTLVWIRDFSYSYNDPMTKQYFSHPAFGNYPVVGITWKQAMAFCNWRSLIQNTFLDKNNIANDGNYRLPTEAEWEYAARGGLKNSMYPWGNYYLRNKKGCLMANFKPGRGNYMEDGGFYTVSVSSFYPNNFGLYNMSGNVAEWTSSQYYEGSINFMSDLSPDLQYDANDDDLIKDKRKVIRGGSWKDIGYFLQVGTRTYEYQDTAKSYIGFRCVMDYLPNKK